MLDHRASGAMNSVGVTAEKRMSSNTMKFDVAEGKICKLQCRIFRYFGKEKNEDIARVLRARGTRRERVSPVRNFPSVNKRSERSNCGKHARLPDQNVKIQLENSLLLTSKRPVHNFCSSRQSSSYKISIFHRC